MAETRQQKRLPLSLRVRFKSATVDEFAERHAIDISRGGIFVGTTTPLDVGTLLRFEFQLKDHSRLIQGIGRVVWRRNKEDATEDSPPGMGIKFIKMDAESRRTIQQVVGDRDTNDVVRGQRRPSFFPDEDRDSIEPTPDPEDQTKIRHASEFLASALSDSDPNAAQEAQVQAERARQRTAELLAKQSPGAREHNEPSEAKIPVLGDGPVLLGDLRHSRPPEPTSDAPVAIAQAIQGHEADDLFSQWTDENDRGSRPGDRGSSVPGKWLEEEGTDERPAVAREDASPRPRTGRPRKKDTLPGKPGSRRPAPMAKAPAGAQSKSSTPKPNRRVDETPTSVRIPTIAPPAPKRPAKGSAPPALSPGRRSSSPSTAAAEPLHPSRPSADPFQAQTVAGDAADLGLRPDQTEKSPAVRESLIDASMRRTRPTPTPTPPRSVINPRFLVLTGLALVGAVGAGAGGMFFVLHRDDGPGTRAVEAQAAKPAAQPQSPKSNDPNGKPNPPDPAVNAAAQPAPPTSFPVGTETTAIAYKSNPAGAQVSVNGVLLGTTPGQYDTPIGPITVVVSARGHEPFERSLEIKPRQSRLRTFNLRPLPYEITVTSTPEGAWVRAAGKQTTTPGSILADLDNADRPMRVIVGKAGYSPNSERLDLATFEESNGTMKREYHVDLKERSSAPSTDKPKPAPKVKSSSTTEGSTPTSTTGP